MVRVLKVPTAMRMYFVSRGQGDILCEMPRGIVRWEPRPILRKRRKLRQRLLSERRIAAISLGRVFN